MLLCAVVWSEASLLQQVIQLGSFESWDTLRCDLIVNAHALYTCQSHAWQVIELSAIL